MQGFLSAKEREVAGKCRVFCQPMRKRGSQGMQGFGSAMKRK
jgi:hypothetical protein